jgi:opacity protein-like surface antigen
MTPMRRLFFAALFVSCCAARAHAQADDRPRAEFFGGYSVMRTDYEPELPSFPGLTVVSFPGRQTLHGFNVSATGYLTKGFGLTGDVSAHFTTNRLADPLGGDIKTRIRVYNLLGGPQYKFRNESRVAPFARALAGVAHTSARLSVESLNVSGTSSSTDFALALGGGLDVRVNDRVDLRVFQADYNPVFLSRGNELGFGRSRADNVRFSFGVVFK